MAELDRQLLAMIFELAFEVEKAVLNGDLEPFEVLSLSDTIHYLSTAPSGLPPSAFRYFVAKLQGLHSSRRKRMHSRGSTTRATQLSLDQQLVDATKYYSVKSTKITLYQISPATFESCHLIVTPTSRYLEGPIPDQSNSVLRRFGNHECFLRVSIQDERRSKLRREPGIDISELLQSRFGLLLTQGLHLGGRQYEFLGYSMSGFQEHSVWFVTLFESDTGRMEAAKIREKLVRPYSDSKLCLTQIDLTRGTFLSFYMNLLALLLAGLKHFPQQIHLSRLTLTRFTELKIVYHRKELSPPMAAVQYPLNCVEQSGPNLEKIKLATRTYARCPLVCSSVLGVQRVSLYKTLPSMAKSFVFDPRKPSLMVSTTLPSTSSQPRLVRSPCS
jgi:hypothetical protein